MLYEYQYLCAYLKRYHANLSLKQGCIRPQTNVYFCGIVDSVLDFSVEGLRFKPWLNHVDDTLEQCTVQYICILIFIQHYKLPPTVVLRQTSYRIASFSGVDFMKGLRLSPVSGGATGSILSLLAMGSLCLKRFSQMEPQLRPSLLNNHSGFLCHVTLYCSQNMLLMTYVFLV